MFMETIFFLSHGSFQDKSTCNLSNQRTETMPCDNHGKLQLSKMERS